MYEVWNSFKWKPIPKFQKYLINFEKPQNFSKTPKPKFQNMKYMKNKRLETYQEKKNLEKAWKITKEEVWSERESVWEMNKCGQIERDQRNENRIAKNEYIDP